MEHPRILSARSSGVVKYNDRDVVGYRVGIYEPIPRKSDGVKTLRLVGNVGPTFVEKRQAEEFGEEYCSKHEDEYFFVPGVSHGALFDRLPEGIHTYFDFIDAME